MKRFVIIAALVWGASLVALAADGKFTPLSPEGFPLTDTNRPASVAPPAGTAAFVALETNKPTVVDATGEVMDDRHKLAPGDKLSFRVLEDRHLPNFDDNRNLSPVADQTKSLVVADTGELDVPYVGRVNVSGKTCKEVAAELKTLLEKDYYYRATVVLGLDQMSRMLGRVYVWGEVRNQGPVEIPANENFTAGKAILRAGGFNDWAKKSKVKVVRAAKGEGTAKEEILVDMEQVLDRGQTDKDVPVQPDDFIIVPRSKINF